MAADLEPRVKALERSVSALTKTCEDQTKSLQGVDTLQKQITDLKKVVDGLVKELANKADKKSVEEVEAKANKKREEQEQQQQAAIDKEIKNYTKEQEKINADIMEQVERQNLQTQFDSLTARVTVLERSLR